MASEQLATYLNDHVAGSVVAIELLEHLETTHAGTPLQKFLTELRAAIEADRKKLESLMATLGIEQSSMRKASAWISEKFTEVKLRVDDPGQGALLLLESVEVLSLGVEGKKLLWRSLEAAGETVSELRTLDYGELIQRAEKQRADIEAVRLAAARKALGVS
jgi:hypothetical protein